MECPKCHKKISEQETVCPHCHKVLVLECPNCHSKGENAVCEKCGYIILTKCTKCSRTVSTASEKCKCGFPVASSIAYQECDSDEFAAIVIKFSALSQIKRLLKSSELYKKFSIKLRNLLTAQLKGVEGKVIAYQDVFVVNFNKELSFQTSANKAVRLALKIANAFTTLNTNVKEELGTSLKLNISIVKKRAEDLLKQSAIESNVKLLNIKKLDKKYLSGMQIMLDQYVWDNVNKDYKTDSLFSTEQDGRSTMYYELLLENYILPPSENVAQEKIDATPVDIQKENTQSEEDSYTFKIFDINAKCNFKRVTADSLLANLDDDAKIISIRADKEFQIDTAKLVQYYTAKGLRVLHVACTEEMNYKPWGALESLYREFLTLPYHNSLINQEKLPQNALSELVLGNARKASTPEDARFAYLEDFENFLRQLKNCVVLFEGFECIDDTTIQTLELYFDKFKRINVPFVFLTNSEVALHSKIKGLMRTPLYTEYVLTKTNVLSLIGDMKEDASDFIDSFYFEKIKENHNGSLQYFENALELLAEKDVLISFEGKLLIKSNNSVVLPNSLEELVKARLKVLNNLSDNASLILAYASYLGHRLDLATLEKLGVKDIENSVKLLVEKGFARIFGNILYINNYNLVKTVVCNVQKASVVEYLCKNIIHFLGDGLEYATMLLVAGKLGMFKEEYMLLLQNSIYSMQVGDYDAYLKNCEGFLAIAEHVKTKVSQKDLETDKKEVYQNILMSLYAYSPRKIYPIEKVLLEDALQESDDEKIVKLSNLMLQGALLSANYTEALPLLHNILSRIPNPTLLVNGAVNARFLLLSLINIEILFNLGDFVQCVDVAKDLLSVIKPDLIDKIKPAGFSVNLFVNHLSETFRMAAFAKLFLAEDDMEEYFLAVETSLGTELQDASAIRAIREFLKGENYAPSNVEDASAYSKVIYLILQEFSEHKDDYKTFAQNIYQAKLLAAEINQYQLEMFCDLLIGYAYSKAGAKKKAEIIFNDVLENSQKSAIFNTTVLAKYFIAQLKVEKSEIDEALQLVNECLAQLQKYNNRSKIIYVLFEKLFIEIVKSQEMENIDVDSEEQKLALATSGGKLARLIG